MGNVGQKNSHSYGQVARRYHLSLFEYCIDCDDGLLWCSHFFRTALQRTVLRCEIFWILCQSLDVSVLCHLVGILDPIGNRLLQLHPNLSNYAPDGLSHPYLSPEPHDRHCCCCWNRIDFGSDDFLHEKGWDCVVGMGRVVCRIWICSCWPGFVLLVYEWRTRIACPFRCWRCSVGCWDSCTWMVFLV